MFIAILALSAFVIAGVAAYFSVYGIATLYAGAFIPVLVMAGALEVGKLVATSFLYRYWEKINLLLKTYLLISVLALMGITSMGIFGFLTSAYQTSLAEYSTATTQQEFLVSQKAILQSELDSLNTRIQTLNDSRKSQESRLPSMSRSAARPVYEDIARAGEEIKEARTRIQTVYDEIKVLDSQNFELQKQTSKQKDIGTLKYAAELFNTDINTIVKWFTIMIIFVFDPLAVCLVLAYNVAIGKKVRLEDINIIEENAEESQPTKGFLNKLIKRKVKYRN
jgi:DNA repair exonuclease SbcCD ATPase subunit